MGFFGTGGVQPEKSELKLPNKDFLHKQGCAACPLNEENLSHPKMKATGADKPLVYIVGEAPGKTEDEEGRQFIGSSGRILRAQIPSEFRKQIRWNNTLNCFPETALVRASGIQKIFRRWYSGPLVTIYTRKGRILSGTPNHPVFTDIGKIAIGRLEKGSNLFCCTDSDGIFPPSGPNIYDIPTPIGEIFSTLSSRFASERMVGSRFNFHGDGEDGQVDVITINGMLGDSVYPNFFEESLQNEFVRALCKERNFFVDCKTSSNFVDPCGAIGARVIPVPKSFSSFRFSMRSIPNPELLGRGSNSNAMLFEKSSDFGRLDLQSRANFSRTDPSLILGNYCGRDVCSAFWTSTYALLFLKCPQLDTIGDKDFSNQILGSFKFLSNNIQGNALSVELDDVVFIRRTEYSGHVYNLQTEGGWYIADDVLVSNCRPPGNRKPEPIEIECCRPRNISDIERTQPPYIFGMGDVALKWALGATGIMSWRGRRVPIKVGNHSCWFYPIVHPSFVLRNPGGEDERMFRLDLQRAFDEIEQDKLPDPIVHTAADARKDVEWVTGRGKNDLETVIAFLKEASKEEAVGLDYETNKLRPYTAGAKICTIAVSTEKKTLAFPWKHRQAGWTPDQFAKLDKAYRDFLLSPKVCKAVHNLAFEMEWTAVQFGREYLRASLWEDTMSQAAILDERKGGGKPGAFALDFLTLQYFGINIKPLSSVNTKNIDAEPLEEVLPYNGIDAKYHRLLYFAQAQRLVDEDLEEIYREHLRRIPTVVLTQVKGLPVDQTVVRSLDKKYSNLIEKIKSDVQEIPLAKEFVKRQGHPFNPSSQDDVVYVCQRMLKHPGGLTKKGNYSTEQEILEQIGHPLTDAVIEYRHAIKQHSTYIVPLKVGSPILFADGLLHPILNTNFAKTGRLTSEDPNEQNFPKRDDSRKEVRKQIKPSLDELVVALDYGQIEARVIAMYSKDRVFCKALWENYDVHAEWTHRIAKAYPRWYGREDFNNKKVFKKYRDKIKNEWTFPLFFGAALDSAAYYLGIPEEKLVRPYDDFWRTFEGVKAWQEKLIRFYKKNGYVQYYTGRRRRGPMSLNEAINAPIQGTTADIVLNRMSEISEQGAEKDWNLQPILNVHDDLTFVLPKKGIDARIEWIIERMLRVPYDWVNVPVQVELSIGPDWCDLEEVGKFTSDKWFKDEPRWAKPPTAFAAQA